ncbi:uncharacterized protein LOC129293629 isoform X2 [Prosopis cineraria]|uniref:uncharacterized protein LOC129293629 isoform X2 n=1 Tax=Prosopis cineraria TaxID=364024 RepID=UPI00240FA9C2|nr:uncharacterized protein LOC129293629 isoform X2 [Prosopis cineraria]
MYRSFMTCDDPKGVVDCGAIRKSRAGSQKMKDKMKSRRTAEKSEASLPKKSDREEIVPKGSTESSVDPSSLQLMEVSRGVQKLNNMVDSWSRDMRYNVRSENIAKDLLEGALDLQESLAVLRKLQEASQHKCCLQKKQNEKPERGRTDAKMMDGTYTNQFSELSYPMGFERPPLSAHDSSRNCREELKKVIKDSLVRQNLFTSSSEVLDSASEIPSTSSSQSSGVHADRLSDSSFSSGTSKVRGPNLVAKLMGLEEATSRSFPAAAQKQLQGEKILNQKRPTFEIDIPKLKKTSSIIEKVDPERKKTLSEILERIHFKGLLKKSSVLEPNLLIHHSNDYRPKQCDSLPPIVLMKPGRSLHRESVKSHAPPDPEGLSLAKPKAEVVPSKSFKQKGSTSMGNRADHVTKGLTHEEKPKILKEFVKLDEKVIMPVEKSPNMVKSYSNASHKLQVQEANEKKAEVKTVTRKLPEKEISKPKLLTRSQDRSEITSTKLRTPPSELTRVKNETSCQQSTALIISPKTKTLKHLNFKQRKNQNNSKKPIPEPEEAKPVDEQSGPEEEKSIAVPCEDDCTEIRTIAEHAVEFLVKHEVDASLNKIDDCYQRPKSSGNDVMLLKLEQGIDSTSAEEAYDGNNGGEVDGKADKEGAELKYFLLTNQLFIGHAEELLNLDVDCPMTLQKYETNGIAYPKLYLDCANELTERKSLQDSQMVHPFLLTRAGNVRLQISLGRLVEEIYNSIEKLKFYTMISGEKFSTDDHSAMMQRDIKCNGLINGIWDYGWKHGFSADESEQVVSEVESLVLCGLIEELILDL